VARRALDALIRSHAATEIGLEVRRIAHAVAGTVHQLKQSVHGVDEWLIESRKSAIESNK
jgi:hypothetical protein